MEGFILLARNYPAAMTSMVCLCSSFVNRLDKAANCVGAYLSYLLIRKYGGILAWMPKGHAS